LHQNSVFLQILENHWCVFKLWDSLLRFTVWHIVVRTWDNSISVPAGYGLDGAGSILGMAEFFSTPQLPDQLFGPPILLSHG
jgi:hypothetical protein